MLKVAEVVVGGCSEGARSCAEGGGGCGRVVPKVVDVVHEGMRQGHSQHDIDSRLS